MHDVIEEHGMQGRMTVPQHVLGVVAHAQAEGTLLAPEVAHFLEVDGLTSDVHLPAADGDDVVVDGENEVEWNAKHLLQVGTGAHREALALVLVPDGKREDVDALRLELSDEALDLGDLFRDELDVEPAIHDRRDDRVLKVEPQLSQSFRFCAS